MNARLGRFTLFGGALTERTKQFKCSQPDNPNTLLFCDQRDYDIPSRTMLKLNTTYALPWYGLQLAAVVQSYAPAQLPSSGGGQTFNLVASQGAVNWQLTPASRYAANCPGPCTPGALVIPNMTLANLVVPLTPGNTQQLERLNQLDLSVNKAFVFGRNRLQARVDLFNALNNNAVLTVRSSNFGVATFRQPATILDGRTLRIGIQMSF